MPNTQLRCLSRLHRWSLFLAVWSLALGLAGLLVAVYAVMRVREPGVMGTEHDWMWWLLLLGAVVAGFGLMRMERWLPELCLFAPLLSLPLFPAVFGVRSVW